jgi:hypothetical protein
MEFAVKGRVTRKGTRWKLDTRVSVEGDLVSIERMVVETP